MFSSFWQCMGSILEQYSGRWHTAIIHGRWARFSGLFASYNGTKATYLCKWKLGSSSHKLWVTNDLVTICRHSVCRVAFHATSNTTWYLIVVVSRFKNGRWHCHTIDKSWHQWHIGTQVVHFDTSDTSWYQWYVVTPVKHRSWHRWHIMTPVIHVDTSDTLWHQWHIVTLVTHSDTSWHQRHIVTPVTHCDTSVRAWLRITACHHIYYVAPVIPTLESLTANAFITFRFWSGTLATVWRPIYGLRLPVWEPMV